MVIVSETADGTNAGVAGQNAAQTAPASGHQADGTTTATATAVGKQTASGAGNHKGPPPIPHVTTNYVPLSHLTAALTNKAYGELQNLMETLPSVSSDLARKRSLLDYIVGTRQEFVKLYVLTKWADVASEVSRTIDVVAWLNGQSNCFANVVNVLYDIERGLGGAKLREPDVETALQVLHYGRPTQPDRGFAPRKPLSPQTVLRTVRELNVLLSIRLALGQGAVVNASDAANGTSGLDGSTSSKKETAGPGADIELPPEYRDYEIVDGRVRFRVGGAYEVDLGVADDSVDARFFLVDFRFAFEGAAATLPVHVRAELEARVNQMLADRPMVAVLHWLLRFANNYKLAALNDELLRLERKTWAGVLSHTFYADRSLLVVQYWRGAGSRPRSLLEIGLQKSHFLGVRWTREGRTVPYPLESGGLESMEALLADVTARHVRWIVSSVYRGLRRELYGDKEDQQEEEEETDDEYDDNDTNKKDGDGPTQSIVTRLGPAKFALQLTPSRHTVFTVDPLTGRVVLQNATQLVMSAERGLNESQDLVSQGPALLAQLRFMSTKDEIEMKAGAAGWVAKSSVQLSNDDMRKYFGAGASVRLVFALRRPEWPLSWFLVVAVTSAVTPPLWFLSQLESKGKTWVVHFMERITVDVDRSEQGEPRAEAATTTGDGGATTTLANNALDYRLFDELGRFATSRFLAQSISADMDRRGVQYTLLQEGGTARRRRGSPVIVANLPTIMKSSWAQSALLISLDDTGETLFLQGRSQRSLATAGINVSKSQDLFGVDLDPKAGTFRLRIPASTAMQSSLVAAIVARLAPIERMLSYVELVESLSLTLTAASMTSLTFEYGPGVQATIGLVQSSADTTSTTIAVADNTAEPVTLTLSTSSPHRIVALPLQQLLAAHGLAALARVLTLTLPLFTAIDRLRAQLGPDLVVVPRGVSDLRLVLPTRKLALEVRVVRRGTRDMAYVRDVSKEDLGVPSPLPPDLWRRKFPDPAVLPLASGAVAPAAKGNAILEHVFSQLDHKI